MAFTCLRSLSSVFEPGMFTMIIGHVTFQVAFVALVVRSRLASFNNEIEEASPAIYKRVKLVHFSATYFYPL